MSESNATQLWPTIWAWKEWIENMEKEGKITDLLRELKVERLTFIKKVEELDKIIMAIESRTENGSEGITSIAVTDSKEFERSGIAEAAVVIIRRANRGVHIKEVNESLEAGGYEFRTDKPLASISNVLWQAAKKKTLGIMAKGNNVYSIEEIEESKNIKG